MKSDIEEHCRSVFHHYLESTTQATHIVWEEHEAPDYWLCVHGDKYAAEVTTLMERVNVGELELPWIGIIASLWDLVDDVEESAREEGILHGTYGVSFSRPIEGLSSIRSQLSEDLLSYVRDTREVGTAPQEIVFDQGSQKYAIKKSSGQKSRILKLGPTCGKWEGEISEDICRLLQERIDTKRGKLRDVSEPRVLLLYDAYRLASLEAYESCLGNLEHLDEFHTVFIVGDAGLGWVLHSQNPDWMS